MAGGWRRAFCTSISRDRDRKESMNSSSSTPRIRSKFAFFSNPSTPRLQSPPVSSPSLRCRTVSTASAPSHSLPGSPKLQCKTKERITGSATTPSSPRSPSTFSFLKSSLRSSRIRCGICLQSLKTGQGTAIFTAECSHSFHFPCIAAHVKKEGLPVCLLCNTNWKEFPVLNEKKPDPKREERKQQQSRSDLKVYNDDEPLMSPKSVVRFNPIPEEGDNENENDDAQEFQGFFVSAKARPVKKQSGAVEVVLMPESVIVAMNRSYETYAAVLKVKAPPPPSKNARAPIDLVAVLDVRGTMSHEKLQTTKRAMHLLVSSLSSADRLSIVAFAATSKRVLPLRRMTANGRLSARRIVDAIVSSQGTSSATDALKKAAKVLEDRRDRNPAASIILMSNGKNTATAGNKPSIVTTTRFGHLDIPVHSIAFGNGGAFDEAPYEAFARSVAGLLSVVVHDLRLQLDTMSGNSPAAIAAVYSCTGRPASLGAGSVRVGDLYAEEERDLLIELKVPSSSIGAHHVLSVRCSHKDPSTQELIYGRDQSLVIPKPQAVRSSTPSIERLRSLFFTTRAVAESRLLIERNDLTAAHHMLSSARALLTQSRSRSGSAPSAADFIRGLEAELGEVQWRRQKQKEEVIQRQRTNTTPATAEEKGEALTPTSAWRAAERLAKVAMMRKSLNRVSDLHGFENARF